MWLKKNLYAFFWEDYCADKPQILTSINHISSETPFKEFRCDDCLESRRWTEANSPRFFTHFTWTKSQGHWLVMIAWWYDENLREYFSNCSHGRVYGCKWNCWAVEMQFFEDGHNLDLPAGTMTCTSTHHLMPSNWIKQETTTVSSCLSFLSRTGPTDRLGVERLFVCVCKRTLVHFPISHSSEMWKGCPVNNVNRFGPFEFCPS